MHNQSTICAISTPAGIGGIAVARISGPQAIAISDRIWHGKSLEKATSHTAHLGTITDPESGETLDQAVATVFRVPNSFTGEDVVEISVHGSQWIQFELINLLIRQGCRMAEAGEFTRRAFTNGRIDLAEAEAVADVIAADSKAANRIAQQQLRGAFSHKLNELRQSLIDLAALIELELDFSEEDVEFADRNRLMHIAQTTLQTVENLAASFATGQAIRNGIPVAIVGAPNAGKSSVLNMLLGDHRAIVSNIPGTTRDTVEDTASIGGYTFRFIDTAGLRDTDDMVENLGIERTWQSLRHAHIALWIIDATTLQPDNSAQITQFAKSLINELPAESTTLLVLNKTDLLADTAAAEHLLQSACKTTRINGIIPISAKTASGLPMLTNRLISIIADTTAATNGTDAVIVTNARHYQALLHAAESLHRVIDGLTATIPSDLIAQDVRETTHHLSTITGAISTPDILSTIFSRFCIGK